MENERLEKALQELHEDLQVLEELAKGPNFWKDKDPAKYKKMLAQLARDRKTVGHKERATQQILQGKRRERGGSGTTAGQDGKSGHSSGHNKQKTGSAVKHFQSSEKKAGQKMSQDRINNKRGYESKNVRLVPQSKNRGDEENESKKKWLKNKKKKK